MLLATELERLTVASQKFVISGAADLCAFFFGCDSSERNLFMAANELSTAGHIQVMCEVSQASS